MSGYGWLKVTALASILALGTGVTATPVQGQSIGERIRRAAEEAQKKLEEQKRKAEEEQRRKQGDPGGTGQQPATPATPAAPAGGTPQSASPNSAASARPRAPASSVKSSAKVESDALATLEPGQPLDYDISPKGHHVAAIMPRGSRQVMVYDGVASQPFDQIVDETVTFSDNGARYAYIAKAGQDWVYMVDGKELVRFPVANLNLKGGAIPPDEARPQFSPNGRHVYFIGTSNPPAGNPTVTPYWDGKPGPSGQNVGGIELSPDGERYAYIVRNQNTDQMTLIVDGKPAGWQGGDPHFTGDSKHIVTGMLINGGGTDVQLDGKPWFRAPSGVRLQFAPLTDLVLGLAAEAPPRRGWFLYVNGKRVPGSEAEMFPGAIISDDGKHWAAIGRTAAMSEFVIADGKKGLEYKGVDNLGFLPDGRVFYRASMPQRQFVVVGDQESNGYQQIMTANLVDPVTMQRMVRESGGSTVGVRDILTANGHVAFGARNTQNASVIVHDGKAIPVSDPRGPMYVTLSPGGTRTAFVLGGNPNLPVVDGTVQNNVTAVVTAFSRLVFSPDDKHIALFGYSAAPSRDGRRVGGFSVDGKFIPISGWATSAVEPSVSKLTFSPDGKHVFWVLGFRSATGSHSSVYVDGVAAVEINDGAAFAMTQDNDERQIAARWSVSDAGVLTFIATDGSTLKRFRVTPGPDTSVDTLLQLSAIQ